ncbi:MAG: phosphate ABC transporter ATP-binding protein [Planctomycetes bacterium]|nr:phosphate ABC transporter ATP-binding protein [Planctomycetota bacterium]
MIEKIVTHDLSIHFGAVEALRGVNLSVMANEILGVIGPANSGKTSFLRAINRMNDLHPQCRLSGQVLMDGKDVYRDMDVEALRRKVGMVFAVPVALPMSIFDNLAFGPRLQGIRDRRRLGEIAERALKAAVLWDEVKDRLYQSALRLSGGQQQRLCIARTLAVEPEVILFDEPCSGLDPISTAKVEETLQELKKQYTIVFVTNNTKQAARIGDRVAFFLMGELVEVDTAERLFTTPKDKRTEDYVSGRFG